MNEIAVQGFYGSEAYVTATIAASRDALVRLTVNPPSKEEPAVSIFLTADQARDLATALICVAVVVDNNETEAVR